METITLKQLGYNSVFAEYRKEKILKPLVLDV